MSKRIACVILTLCLILGMAPPLATADNTPADTAALSSIEATPVTETISENGTSGSNTISSEGRPGSGANGADANAADASDGGYNLIFGDVNADGAVNQDDVDLLTNAVQGSATFTDAQIYAADVNGDATLTINDVAALTQYVEGNIGLDGLPVASNLTAQGYCGADGINLMWSLDKDGALTVSGTGAMADFEQSETPWFDNYREQITSVVIENGVTHIGDYAFSESENLSNVSVPESVSSMGEGWLLMCYHLSAVTVASGNANYSSDNGILFNKQKSELIVYPAQKDDESYVIPNSVTKIGEWAFSYCPLKNVAIPSGVIEIGEHAFFNCLISGAMDIPESVAFIGDGAFAACYSLSAVNVASGNAQYVSENGVLFNRSKSSLLCYPAGKAGTSYEVPNGVTLIGFDAFSGHDMPLTDVTIPGSVTKIDQLAFSGCGKLTDVYYGGTEAQWKAIEIASNGNDPLLNATIHYNGGGATGATLASVTLNPASVTLDGTNGASVTAAAIGSDNSFFTSGVTWSVTPSGNGVEIADETSGAIAIAADATAGEYTVTATYDNVSKSATLTVTRNSGGDALSGTCGNNLTWTLVNGVFTVSGTGPMTNYTDYTAANLNIAPWYDYRSNITTVVIESGVTSIGNFAFHTCDALTGLTMADSVVSIGNYAFYGCTNLSGVTFHRGLASIGFYAFENCKQFTSMTIPDSLTFIDRGVFAHCSNLTNIDVSSGNTEYVSENGVLFNSSKTALVCYPAGKSASAYTIPNGVTSIIDSAFAGCGGLASVTIPDSVSYISQYAFNLCVGLSSVTIPASVTAVRYGAFNVCNSLADVYYGGTEAQWKTIAIASNGNDPLLNATIHYSGGGTPSDAPSGTCGDNLTWTLVNGTLTISGTGAMTNFSSASAAPWYDYNDDITTVVIENGVTSIGNYAFEYSQMTSVSISDSVASIGDWTFFNCNNLKGLSLPASVASIGEAAFMACQKLESVDVASENAQYVSDNGILFNKDKSVLVCYPPAKAGESYVIPDSVSVIGAWAFDSSKLSNVVIPSGVTVIDTGAFAGCKALTGIDIPASVTELSASVFQHCSSLTSVNVDSANAAYGSDSGIVFSKDGSRLVCYPAGKTATEYAIPSGVTTIEPLAFMSCDKLTRIDIPVSVTSVGRSAFVECAALADAYYGGTEAQWEALKANIASNNDPLLNAAIHYDENATTEPDPHSGTCGDNLTWTLVNGVLTISGAGPMTNFSSDSDVPWRNSRESVTTLIIESGATSIGNYALYNCNNLTNLTVAPSVTSIGSRAFEYCSALTSVDIGPNVTSIGSHAFYGCNSLTNLTIGSRVTSVGSYAFAYCSGLTSVDIGPSVTSIGENAFYYCSALKSATISASVTSIAVDVFCHCSALTGITVLPGNSAYSSENGILFSVDKTQLIRYPSGKSGTTYVVPDGITRIYNDAFCDSNLRGITIPVSVVFIGNNAFYDCDALTDIYYGGTEAQWAALQENIQGSNSALLNATIHYGSGGETPTDSVILAQGSCGGSVKYVLTSDGALTISGTGAMADYSAYEPAPWRGNRRIIKTVTIESGVSSIGAYAFDDCDVLSAMTISNSVSDVAPHAFDGCEALADVSYDGTQEQWDAVIFNTSDNDALEFATVRCGDETYNAFRSMGFFGKDGEKNNTGKMQKPEELTWRFAVPLEKFQNLYIDTDDVEAAENTEPNVSSLVRKDSLDDLSHADGSKEYAATSGSTILTIPAETFETFQEGSHNITATFKTKENPLQPGDSGLRKTSAVYTIFPEGPIDIDESELTANAVQDVSYTGRLQTSPKLSDKFYRFELTEAKLNGEKLTLMQQDDSKQTKNETANEVWKLGEEEFFFHPNGRFSGIPSTPGKYELTVALQVRRELDDDWYVPDPSEGSANPLTVIIIVRAKTEENIFTTSDGYEVIQAPPSKLEQGTPFQMIIAQNDPEDELVAIYLDSELLTQNQDYTVSTQIIQGPQLLEGGLLTQLSLSFTKTDISLGLHSVDVELKHTDPLGNTQTKSVARPLTVTEKRSGGGGGGGGGSSRSVEPRTYAVSVSKLSNGAVSLSASKVAAGQSVTITVTPNNGYQIEKVSVIDSAKKSVPTTRDGNKYVFTMPARAVTVSASFTPSVYSLTVSKAEHGKVTLNRTSAAKGATINGSTEPDKGYLLLSVTVRDASGKVVKTETFDNGKFTFLMPEGRATVSASFTVKRLASFSDIQGPDWFFEDAEWAYNRGILLGTTNQYWEPHSLMSSVTSVVTLERLDGVDLTPYDTGADDGLDNSEWYVAALRWANANRITLSDRPFGGREAIKRGEFAVMLSNYLRYRGISAEVPDGAAFTDADAMTQEELHAFLILQQADVFRGYSDGSIRPETYLNRAQLAALLHRLSAYIIKAETG